MLATGYSYFRPEEKNGPNRPQRPMHYQTVVRVFLNPNLVPIHHFDSRPMSVHVTSLISEDIPGYRSSTCMRNLHASLHGKKKSDQCHHLPARAMVYLGPVD